MTLKQLCAKYKKGDWPDRDSVHSYIDIYEEILAPYRHTAQNILEIGLMSGESLRMWTEYFDGTVYGMDCSVTPIDGLADLRPIMAENKYNICIGDATNEADIEKYFKGIKFNVVIEDSSHLLEHQLKIYNLLEPYMADNSIFIVEDVQDIDKDRTVFENIDPFKTVQIMDRRHLKGRYDDCLVVIKDNLYDRKVATI
jgi:cephalosporin hydroxylase